MLILKGESCCVQYRSERKGANSLDDWGDPRATQVCFRAERSPVLGRHRLVQRPCLERVQQGEINHLTPA